MAQTVQLAGNGLGGLIQGNFGNYTAASDGTYTVDTRDVPALLVAGLSYMARGGGRTTVTAPIVGAAAAIVASAALSAGSLTVLAQPDVMREIFIRFVTGTLPITFGSVAVSYVANDGVLTTDTISAIMPASTIATKYLSKGVAVINTPVVSAISGGVSPLVEFSTNNALAAALPPNASSFTVGQMYVDSTAITSTLGHSLGTVTPNIVPNGTHTYTIQSTFVNPTV